MLDGFHWTRVVSKQLRFLYEEITTLPPPPKMKELAEDIDRGLAAASGATAPPSHPAISRMRSRLIQKHPPYRALNPIPGFAFPKRQGAAIGLAMVQCGTSARSLTFVA